MIFASFSHSFSVNFRVVIAAVPIRIPDGSSGLRVSYGIIFLLVEIPIFSRISSACFPESPVDAKISSNTIWLSVHPEITTNHSSTNTFAICRALSIICRTYVENSGFKASPKATAFAKIICSCGPHWIPGNTARSISFAYFSRHIIIAPRGPRSVL